VAITKTTAMVTPTAISTATESALSPWFGPGVCHGVSVWVLVVVVEPGVLGGVGCEGEEQAGEEGAEERGAAAAGSGDTWGCVVAPVRQADSEQPGEIGEDVDGDEYAPDGEAGRV
jgi:hypothetical protein